MSLNEIRLRAIEPEDVDFMFECDNDEQARIWTDYAAPISRRQLLEYALGYEADPFKCGQLRMIAENEDRLPVGIIDFYEISLKDLRGMIGIYVLPQFRREGVGSKMLEKAINYATGSLGLKSIAAKISTKNLAALSLFVKCGFKEIATLPAWHRIGPDFHDINLMLYSE